MVEIKDKINLTVEEAAEYSNIGVNRLYQMVRSPYCPFVLKIGNRRLIKRKAFEAYLDKVVDLSLD